LLKPNLDLENKTVLFLSFSKVDSDKYMYMQVGIDDLYYDIIKSRIDMSSKCSEELERQNLHFNNNNNDSVTVSSAEDMAGQIIDVNIVDSNGNVEKYNISEYLEENKVVKNNLSVTSKISNIKPYSLIDNVPDSIYKSITNKWICKRDDECLYAYKSVSFAGTDNIQTYLIVMDWTKYYNSSTGVINQVKIEKNVSVLYNVYNGSLGIISSESSYGKIKELKVSSQLTSSPKSNCFIVTRSRERVSGETVIIIRKTYLECVLEWTDLPSIVWDCEMIRTNLLLGSNDTEVYFKDSPSAQKSKYGRSVQRLYNSLTRIIYKAGDYCYVQGSTYVAPSSDYVIYYYSYTVGN
jgi:hypothetical protein